MKLSKLVLLIAAVAMIPVVASARSGENPDEARYHLTTVRYIKKHSPDSQYAVLIGRVTEKIGSETYLFNDGTGTIKLDSSRRLPIGKQIVVRGKVDKDWIGMTSDELDVKSWRLDRRRD